MRVLMPRWFPVDVIITSGESNVFEGVCFDVL